MTALEPDATISANGVHPAQPAEPDDDIFEADWNRPKRTNKLTFVLVAALVAALTFAGGVAVQKHHDAGLAASATAGRTRGAGGFGQGGAAEESGGQGATAAAVGGTPVAIGTVKSISGSTLTITNFAGTVVTVTVPPTATVTTSGLAGLAAGATVSVAGTTNADGSVTATSVTSRKTS